MTAAKFTLVATVLSLFIWYINFHSYGSLSRASSGAALLTVAPNKWHVLVTGGAGFIGSHAALYLMEQGHTVTVVDNLSRGNKGAVLQLERLARGPQFRYVNVDLGDRDEVAQLLVTSVPKIDLVMHFAAIAYVGESMSSPLMYYENVTVNTVNLLHAMAQAQIHQLVYSSTCAVYGNADKLPITEDTPPKPINPYGESKLMAENIIRAYAKSDPAFKAIILRYFNVYGSDPLRRLGEFPRPELRRHSRISGACMDAALGIIPRLEIHGTKHPTRDGTCVRDFIHVTDLISAHIVAMTRLNNPIPLYNIGTGRGVSVDEFVTACKKVTGRTIEVVKHAEARPGDYAEVYADPARINRELGWRANFTNIEDGLRHAWEWRLQHPDGYGLVAGG